MKLYNTDCFNILCDIPDNSIDLILCDLPYGVTAASDDICLPLDRLWVQYERIIKNNGCIALFAQGIFYIDLINSNRKLFRYDLVWDKVLTTGFLNANRMPLRRHEQIAIFYKSQPTFNPQKTEGKPCHSKGKMIVKHNNNYGKYTLIDNTEVHGNQKFPSSILRFSKTHPAKSVHKTEKPVELCEWLIRTYSNEGDTVLDNCMGSGTTGVAAKKLNRKFIGIEIDKNAFIKAEERIYGCQN